MNMHSAFFFAPLVTKTVIIDGPGKYLTRGGEVAIIEQASTRHDLNCKGTYEACGTVEGWHKSGRLFSTTESRNDIVSRA